jgi:DNA-binding NtrC family response regulator
MPDEMHNENGTWVFLGMPAVIASAPMHQLMAMVERVARSSATVLISGESGSGKELIARAVHHYSNRGHKPWVDLSCAALPEHLLESELFGYDKGAFSGADSAKQGLFELAHQGTIFLDEIGELDPKMQVKLLRVLDGVPYYRLGGVRKVTVDVRVVAATNQDLEAAVAEGRFRSDLYHRLSMITLRVPPLRKRVEDIRPLALHFLTQYDARLRFSAAALDALAAHSWPGNIRELRNVVTKAAVLAPGDLIAAEDLPLAIQSGVPEGAEAANHASGNGSNQVPSQPSNQGTNGFGNGHAGHGGNASLSNLAGAISLDGMERRMIMEALKATGGHQEKAAARLGISRRTLSRKLKLYEGQPEGAALSGAVP